MDWGGATTRSSYGCANACGRTAGNRAAASRTRTVLSTTQAIALKRDPGNRWAGVTVLCARCENPILARARRNAVCCLVRRCGGFKLDKRGRKGAAQLRPCAVDRG
jgi:hypothetical protein